MHTITRWTLASAVMMCSASASAQIHNENRKLLPNNGEVDATFGFGIDADNGIIAVGAPFVADEDTGSVYLFDQGTGQQLGQLFPDEAQSYANFGVSVAIEGNLVVVGSHHPAAGLGIGSAYIFDATTGQQLHKLTPDTGDEPGSFGVAVDIEDGIVAVGSPNVGPGAVYLFDAATGAQLRKIIASDVPSDGDEFGAAIDMDNGILAVGVPGDHDNGNSSGSAYLYNIDTGNALRKFKPADGAPNNLFGSAIAIEGDRIIVGAPGGPSADGNGWAYLFSYTNNTVQQIKLLHRDFDAGTYQHFARSISIENGRAAIGAMGSRLLNDVQYHNAGAVYLFDTQAGDRLARFVASDAASGDTLGRIVAMDGNSVYSGAIWDDDNGDKSGSAYEFRLQCDADLTGDGAADFLDISFFTSAYNSGDLAADLNGDGELDFIDISAFIDAYTTGCP